MKSMSVESRRKVLTLPRVEHPSTKINSTDQQLIDIRGTSRYGTSNEQIIRQESSTPNYSRLSQRRKSSFSRKSSSNSQQIRLPIFGYGKDRHRSSLSTRDQISSLSTNEFVEILREKVLKQKCDLKRKFIEISNGNRNGKISRQALRHLISSIFGIQYQLSQQQIDSILNSLQFKDQQEINFDEFLRAFHLIDMKTIDRIVEESSRSSSSTSFSSSNEQTFVKPTAKQMFDILKQKILSKSDDLTEIFPSLSNENETNSKSKVYRNEFRQNLIRLGFHLEENQFKKLWKRFDPDGFHSIDLEKILHLIRNEEFLIENHWQMLTSETQDQQKSILNKDFLRSSLSRKTPRLTTVENDLTTKQIHLWILHKFPHGFSHLEKSLEKFDENHSGLIRRQDFENVFRSFGFHLDGNLFDLFFERLNLPLTNSSSVIYYRNVLQALKQRVTTNQFNKQIQRILSTGDDESFEKSLFGQIQYLFRMNFHRIEKELNLIDSSQQGKISSDQWKTFIENLIEFPLSPDEYHQLIQSFPRDQSGSIRWKDFLKQIQKSSSLNNSTTKSSDSPTKIPDWDYMRSKNIRERLDLQHLDRQKSTKSNEIDRTINEKINRSFEQLHQILKRILRHRYKDVEDQFHNLDQSSYGELTKDLLFQLFQRLSIDPSINRREIDLIWSKCHLKENGNLDFYQFLREFGYSKRSAHYPNAKQNPPKRGDADFLLTSRKLYGDSVLVHGTALNAIRSNWNELRREFTQLDPYRTGFIQSDEFDDILIDLCPSVNEQDLEILREKFQTKTDSRTNYIRFLKYHSPIAQFDVELPSIDESKFHWNSRSHFQQLKNKIRSKLMDKENLLRRSFRDEDKTNTGRISVLTLKKLLDEYHCHFNDEEFYFLLSQFEQSIDGFINYQEFIQRFLH